jgi:integrase
MKSSLEQLTTGLASGQIRVVDLTQTLSPEFPALQLPPQFGQVAGDIRAAQLQLGHRSLKMTEHYVRERKGDKVGPTK